MSLYETLGFSKYDIKKAPPSIADIKRNFKRLSLEHHPDKNGGCGVKFCELGDAYDILGNDRYRKIYDVHGLEAVRDQMQHDIKARTNHQEHAEHPPSFDVMAQESRAHAHGGYDDEFFRFRQQYREDKEAWKRMEEQLDREREQLRKAAKEEFLRKEEQIRKDKQDKAQENKMRRHEKKAHNEQRKAQEKNRVIEERQMAKQREEDAKKEEVAKQKEEDARQEKVKLTKDKIGKERKLEEIKELKARGRDNLTKQQKDKMNREHTYMREIEEIRVKLDEIDEFLGTICVESAQEGNRCRTF